MSFQGSDNQVILYDYALRFVGVPYRWGGDDPMAGFDCSGLVGELLKSVGLVGRTFRENAAGLHRMYIASPTSLPDLGALAFFGVPEISHVGFCLNPDLMLESGSGTAETTSLEVAERQNAFVRVRPIKSRKDFIGCFFPPYPWRKP